jgi:tetratricopeptide (TPR) repeat protein
MKKHRIRVLLVLPALLLLIGAVSPAEAQRRGGGQRKARKTPVPPPAAEAPADAGPPAGEPAPPPAAEPSPQKDAAVLAAEPEILAYAIGPARAALARTGDPAAAPALVAEGRVLTLEKKYDEAVSRFDRAAAAAPGDAAPLVFKGEALLYARQDGPARQALSTAKTRAQARVESNPSDADAWLYLGMAQRHLGEHDAAYGTLERAKALAPGDERITYEMGATRYVQQRWQPAIDLLTSALASNPRLAYAYYLRGIAASQADRKDLTVNDLGRFLELAPGAPEAERARKVLDSLK